MNKKEFIQKYDLKVVSFMYRDLDLETQNKMNATFKEFLNICKGFKLKVDYLESHIKYGITRNRYLVLGLNSSRSSFKQEQEQLLTFDEFITDFKSIVDDDYEVVNKVMDIINHELNLDCKRIETRYGVTAKGLQEEGFLQSTTTSEYSLWWTPSGRRVVFVFDEGIFEIVK